MLDEAFLHDILEHPDDDTVRLIYADWLTEYGDPRGEFIQVQCQLARCEGTLTGWDEWGELASRLPHLRQRKRDLRQQHGEEWAWPLHDLVRGYDFRRGFVEDVSLSASVFVQRGQELFRLAPVRRVRFTTTDVPMTRLAGCPHLAQLSELDFRSTYP